MTCDPPEGVWWIFVGLTVVWAVSRHWQTPSSIKSRSGVDTDDQMGWGKSLETHLQKAIFGTFSMTWSLWWSNFDGKSEWITVNHAESLKFMFLHWFYMTACNASMAPNVKPMQVASPWAQRAGWWQQCCPGRLPDNYIDPSKIAYVMLYKEDIFNY